MLARRTLASLLRHQQAPTWREARNAGPSWRSWISSLSGQRASAVGVCDERSREREQTDCEHDERAVQ